MIDTLIQVVDRLIQLRTYRETRLQKMFKEVVAPVFEDLLAVHKDYIDMFLQASEHLRGSELVGLPDRMDLAIKDLESDRLLLEPVRVKLETLVRRGGDPQIPSEVAGFVMAIGEYLLSEPYIANLAHDSSATNLIETLRYFRRKAFGHGATIKIEPESEIPKVLRGFVGSQIAAKREKWAVICEHFIELQLAARGESGLSTETSTEPAR